jgi:hypothetical protein
VEKLVYLLIGPSGGIGESFSETLRHSVVDGLRTGGASRIQVNLGDPSLGNPFGVEPDPSADTIVAAVSFWVDSAETTRAFSVLPASGDTGAAWHGYLVAESEPLPLAADDHPRGPDGRVPGFSQLVALRRPGHLSWGEWRRIWQTQHTPVAIHTQSSFRYVQNVILRPVTTGAPAYAAVVEECFPIEAAADLHVFFDAVGDDAKLSRHMSAMSESCDRFMDGVAPVSWTSAYLFP